MARRARLRRGLDRRAPLGGLRDHRLAGGVHRRGGRAHAPHQARHRRLVAAVPPPVHPGRPHPPARRADARPRDVRRRSRRAADRRVHDGHRPADAARPHARVAARDRAAPARRDRHDEDGLVRAARSAPAAAAVHRGGRRDRGREPGLAGRRARRGRVRPVAALARRDHDRRLQRAREHLVDLRGARQGVRSERVAQRLAPGRADAPRRDARAGARRREASAWARGAATSARSRRCRWCPRAARSTTRSRR